MTRFVRLALSAGAIALLSVVSAAAVTNGTPDGGGHPFVGWVFGETPEGWQTVGCSGVLVAENVVLTSGECSYFLQAALAPNGNLQHVWVTFEPEDVAILGGVFDPPNTPPSVKVIRFATNPAYVENRGKGKDIANVGVLILETPVAGPYANLPVLNRLDALAGDEAFTAAAYGTLKGQTVATLMRRFAEARFQGIGPNSVSLHMVDNGPDPACIGPQNEGGGAFLGTSEAVALIIEQEGYCARTDRFQRLDVENVRSFLSAFVPLP